MMFSRMYSRRKFFKVLGIGVAAVIVAPLDVFPPAKTLPIQPAKTLPIQHGSSIAEILNQNNEILKDAAMVEVNTVRTTMPVVQWRKLNKGIKA